MSFALLECGAASMHVITALLGLTPPPLHDAPYRALTVSEFWGRRWNLTMSSFLREHCFAPLSRRSPVVALFASFAASAAIHAYLAAVALGALAALSWVAFFLAQPLVIATERRLHVRRWPPAAGWVWTVAGLALFSPLFLEPFLWLFEARR